MTIFYSLIVSVVLLIMWGAYRLSGVGGGRDFALSRRLLVGSVLFALGVAALPFLIETPQSAPPVGIITIEPGVATVIAADAAVPTLPLLKVVVAVYWLGFGVCALRLLLNVGRIVLIIARSRRCGPTLRLHDDARLVPFTWGRWIVMSQDDYRRSGAELMAHEGAHLRARHWLDLLLINAVQCLTWYAPGAPLLRRELSKVHEFVADRAVIDAGFDNEDYLMLLISKASGRRFANSVTAGINKSIIKQRIAMMQKSLSVGSARKRALALIPAAVLAVVVATNPAVASEASSLKPSPAPDPEQKITIKPAPTAAADSAVVEIDGTVTDTEGLNKLNPASIKNITVDKSTDTPRIIVATQQPEPESEKVHSVVEIAPVFRGGEIDMFKYLSQNIRYPKQAIDKDAQGRVIVQFVVKTDGTVGDVKVIRGVEESLDAEAIRVVKTMTGWTPGKLNGKPVNVWFTLPISFKFQADSPEHPEPAK